MINNSTYCDKTRVSSYIYVNDYWIKETRNTNRLILITAWNEIFFFQVYVLIRVTLVLWKKKVRICTCQLVLPSLSGNKFSRLAYEWTWLFCQKKKCNLDISFNKQQIVKNNLIWLLVPKIIKNVSVNTLPTKGWLRTISILYWMKRRNMTKNEEKAEVLNAIFTSILRSKSSWSSGSQTSELKDRDREKNKPPVIHGEMVSIVLNHSVLPFFCIQNNKCWLLKANIFLDNITMF